MAVMLIEKDPFVSAGSEPYTSALHRNTNVRRPIYGITLKENSFAYLSVFQDGYASGRGLVPVSLKDSSAPGGNSQANHNFILTSVQDSRQEKAQIIETFGDHYVFLYGEKPIVLQCSGYLMNTADFNWKNEFLHNYETYLRGTKAAENKTRVFLGWDDVLAQGWMLNVSVSYNAEMPYLCPVQFSLLLSAPPVDLSSTTSLVDKSEDARTIGQSVWEKTAVEYHGAVEPQNRYTIDPLTGESSLDWENQSDWWPRTLDNEHGSPNAINAASTDAQQQEWVDEQTALQVAQVAASLAADQAAAQAAAGAAAADGAAFAAALALGARTSAAEAFGTSAGTGVANTATNLLGEDAYNYTYVDPAANPIFFQSSLNDYDASDPYPPSDIPPPIPYI